MCLQITFYFATAWNCFQNSVNHKIFKITTNQCKFCLKCSPVSQIPPVLAGSRNFASLPVYASKITDIGDRRSLTDWLITPLIALMKSIQIIKLLLRIRTKNLKFVSQSICILEQIWFRFGKSVSVSAFNLN